MSAHQAGELSKNVNDHVIVVLRNQYPSLPDTPRDHQARAAAVTSSQRQLLGELRATHARSVKSLSLINAITATVSAREAARLRANPAVARVVQDKPVPVMPSLPQLAPGKPAASPLSTTCSSGNTPQLNPEAVELIHAASQSGSNTAQSLGYTGAGVKVGFIADGLNINNPDFIRANGSHVFVDYQDFSGTGTNAPTAGGEAFLDASAVAAQGRQTYNVAPYAGSPGRCIVRILGVAPGASLVGLNVFGSAEFAYNSVFVDAIDYAVTHDHVNVLNESFGANPFPDEGSLDLDRLADDAAVRAGVTVTVSTGDAGVTNTIGSPATDPNVISAGASTSYRALAQTGIDGITDPHVNGWIDNNISGLSSGGFDQIGRTQDVVAPGDLNWALCSPDPQHYADCTDFNGNPASVELTGGTSQSAPLTAGVAALVIQAYREHHGGATPSPATVKRIITSSAEDISAPADQQGAGLVDAFQAVRAAASYGQAKPNPTTRVAITSVSQFHGGGAPNTKKVFTERLSNTGVSPLPLTLSTRTLLAYRTVAIQKVSLTPDNGFSTTESFTVPAHQARLKVSAAWAGDVRISLISPSGKFADFSRPQGIANFGDAEVAHPQAGRWLALLAAYTVTKPESGQFQASTATWKRFGKLSAKSLTLPAKSSKSFRLTTHTPSAAGDVAGEIIVTRRGGGPAFTASMAVPVTLRAYLPTPSPTSSATGVLTGGNGRDPNTGQTNYYQLRVPRGMRELTATIRTPNRHNTFLAQLVEPATHEAAATTANGLLETTPNGPTLRSQRSAALEVLRPRAGMWTLIVDFYGTVSGTATAQRYHIALSDRLAKASVHGLPTSSKTRLKKGKSHLVNVRVTNTTGAPQAYFIDSRLSSSSTLTLTPQTAASLRMPNIAGIAPVYLVPSHSNAIAATVSDAQHRLYFDAAWAFGDPDLMSSVGNTAKLTFHSSPVAPGDWTITPFLTGPTGANPPHSSSAHIVMTARTARFDPAVRSSTGNLWQSAIDRNVGFTPYVVLPGQTATIPVQIRPTAKRGHVVSGRLYVAASSILSPDTTYNELLFPAPQANDVRAFGYRYRVK